MHDGTPTAWSRIGRSQYHAEGALARERRFMTLLPTYRSFAVGVILAMTSCGTDGQTPDRYFTVFRCGCGCMVE